MYTLSSIKRAFRLIGLFVFLFAHGADAQQSMLNVITDERMELLTVVQYLSDYPVLTPAKLRYKTEVENYFGKYRNHNAVQLNKAIYRRFFGYDIPTTYLYHFSFPDFKQIAPFSKEDIATFGFDTNADTLALLLRELKNFYDQTNFHAFYTGHKPFYDSLIKPVKAALLKTDAIKTMEEHYGAKNKSYNVVLVALEHDGGYSQQIPTSGGNVLYAIIGPKYDSKDVPEFDIDNLLSEYVLHEFSHSFCNLMIDAHRAQLEQDSCLLRPIKKDMKEQGYGSWYSCVIEHFVRANEILLTEKVLGKKVAGENYDNMVNEGWIYLDGLVPIIRRYATDRKKYKTLKYIMPEVVAYFDARAKECK